jgi:hypothetical protein
MPGKQKYTNWAILQLLFLIIFIQPAAARSY